MEHPLAETLRRLRAHVGEDGLDPADLAVRTALPEHVVRALLRGEEGPADTVEERVCERIRTLAEAHVVRTGRRPADLVSEIAARLGISQVWARRLLKGEKLPNVPLLHGLADFFDVDGGEVFFTAPAADALNRTLLPLLEKYENPAADPVQALLRKYGVRAADLRSHGCLTPEQFETLLEGVIKSVLPPEGGTAR
ncbi:hypothetical protein GCM10009535_08180 [Streptomyces thermocarboxydovorans]|uniref:Transcriptional regulator n=1 Tax=Streptomyces thermocarboxydovorans TaxID=59298 RepID=A0ABN1HA10_9ACTN